MKISLYRCVHSFCHSSVQTMTISVIMNIIIIKSLFSTEEQSRNRFRVTSGLVMRKKPATAVITAVKARGPRCGPITITAPRLAVRCGLGLFTAPHRAHH
uniref:Uncharacterized protein n=1 Tax=Cacopsylla melanoneura TaxID=428564 RepID=A0A8D8M3A7_9HEMI